jgi:5-methyltetrahydrofolate--homocysteine methyltransferase
VSDILLELQESIVKCAYEDVLKGLTEKALEMGLDPVDILNDGLIKGIDTLGEKWKRGEAFLPEVIAASKSVKAGMEVIKEQSIEKGVKPLATAVIGTVKGDVHDIGKNLVSMVLQSFGFEVHDLGVDVAAEKFVEEAREKGSQIICMSALLTTTLPAMEMTVRAVKEAGLTAKTLVGGAPVTKQYAAEIGADDYASDAIAAVEVAKGLVGAVKV